MAKDTPQVTDPTPTEAPPVNGQATGLNLAALAEAKEATPETVATGTPDEVKAFVQTAHEYWQANPKAWREVTLATEEAVNEVIAMARKFAKASGRTFRVHTAATMGGKLVYRVTDKVSKPRANGDTEGNNDDSSAN